MHQADAGSDAYDRDFALSLLSQEQDALYEIDEALKRIELGTYGICEMSGKPISTRAPRSDSLRPLHRRMPVADREAEQSFPRSPSVTSLFGLTDDEGGEGEEEETVGRNTRNNRHGPGIHHPRMHRSESAGKPVSRYMSTRNKKSPNTPNRLEKKKYNPFLKRHTLHRETK